MTTEREFHSRIDELMMVIEDAIEEADLDIDSESSNGILTLEFSNGSQVIISRQPSMQQLWLAAKSGGFHFSFDAQKQAWVSTRGDEDFVQRLQISCREQGCEELILSL